MTTTYTSYKLITADLQTSLKRVSEQPDVKRETEYYLAKISSVKSVDDFFADARLYNYAMKAHGLEDMAYAKAFMRKVLTEGVDDKAAFANQLSDTRYKELAQSLNFARHGEVATTFERAQKGVVDKYTRQTLEVSAGELPGILLAEARQVDEIERALDAGLLVGPGVAHDLQRQGDVLLDRAPGIERGGLEDVAIGAAPAGFFRRHAVDGDLA